MRLSFKSRLSLIYLSALGVIAVLTLVSYLIIRNSLLQKTKDAGNIALAGKQRALSQEMIKNAFLLLNASQAEEFREQVKIFENVFSNWSAFHEDLQKRNTGRDLSSANRKKVNRLFKQIKKHFEEISLASLQVLSLTNASEAEKKSKLNLYLNNLLKGDKAYLQLMNEINLIYEQEANQKIARMQTNVFWVMLITLLVLMLEALIIFRPAVNQLHTYFNRLRESNEELTQKNEILQEATHVLDQKNRQIRLSRDQLYEQSTLLEAKNENITNSIRYAKRIQEAIIPPAKAVTKNFKEAFILYLPKDILSGDFYWFSEQNGEKIIIASDCTGHGVPGALMTMMGNSLINEIVKVKGITSPSRIMYELDDKINETFQRESSEKQIHDGMDMVVLNLDEKNGILYFSASHNPLFYFHNSELTITKGSRFPVGSLQYGPKKIFELHTIATSPGDTFYIFTDGFQDQFGLPANRKYMNRRFRDFLISIHHLPMTEQEILLHNEFVNWKGDIPQTDDVLVIGIRV